MATVEKGDRLLESLATGWVTALEDIYRFRQPSTNAAYLP
jgi:creatinine amidohydrolase